MKGKTKNRLLISLAGGFLALALLAFLFLWLMCTLVCVVTFSIGLLIFKKLQRNLQFFCSVLFVGFQLRFHEFSR